MWLRARPALLAVLVTVFVATCVADATGFGLPVHRTITRLGLSHGTVQSDRFVRSAILEDINDKHEHMDSGFSGGKDPRHFDDCEFDGAARWIRGHSAAARRAPGA